MDAQPAPATGISAIAIYQPPLAIGNDWFNGTLSRKFVAHTGIQSRRISCEDEITMGVRAVENLRDATGCDLRNCAGLVLAVSSLLPTHMPDAWLSQEERQRERTDVVVRLFAQRLGIAASRVFGINWGCSGYSRSLQIARRFVLPAVNLSPGQFVLVVTVNRTSKIVDFACKDTGALFGDMAQATLLARIDDKRHPVRFSLEFAAAESRPVGKVLFDFHLGDNTMLPASDGGRSTLRRPVLSMDMMGIGDAAPRAMAAAAADAFRRTGIRPDEVDFVVPHQAGTAVVKLAAMKLEELGVRGEVLNGFTRDVGNVSSSSVPYVLQQIGDRLHGLILCPTAGVGKAGHASFSQGCVILRAVKPRP